MVHVLRGLTGREAEVLAGLMSGWHNKRIAEDLGVTGETVKVHVKGIMRKLGARTRVEVVSRCMRAALALPCPRCGYVDAAEADLELADERA